MRTSHPSLLLICLICLSVGNLTAQESASSIEEALKRRVIDPELPLKEVQEFTERRVNPVPEFESVAQWETFEAQTRQRLFEQMCPLQKADAGIIHLVIVRSAYRTSCDQDDIPPRHNHILLESDGLA